MNRRDQSIFRFSRLVKSFFQKNKNIEESETAMTLSETPTFKTEAQLPKYECQAVFSYTVILPSLDEDEKDLVVLGNFIIKNMGTEVLTYPVICIRIHPPKIGKLGGKIVLNEQLAEPSTQEQWFHVHPDWREKLKETGEYWLKPGHCREIKPGEILEFSNFELTFNKPVENSTVVAEGFVYFNELRNGAASANIIAINF